VTSLLAVSGVAAQISSDQVPQGRQAPLQEQVESQMSQSRWKWGPFRVQQELPLANVGYNANVFGTGSDERSDFSATVGGGVRAIMPLGPKTFLRLDAIPEYTWYRRLDERRTAGWEVGGALLALFNRMQIELAASSRATVRAVSSEELTPTDQRVDRVWGNLEVDVFRRVALFVGGEARETSYDPVESDGDLNLELLERDERLARVGIRYKFRPWANVHAMFEKTEAEFPNDPLFSENEGDAILGGASVDRERFYFNVVAGRRTIEYPESGVTFDEPTGSGFIAFRVFRRTELALTYRARPQYTTFAGNPYFYETRRGINLTVPMGNRLVVLSGYETGTNEFQQPVALVGGGSVRRSDDVTSWNAGLGFPFRRASLDVRYHVDRYESNIGSFSRDVKRIQVSLRASFLTFTTQ
jgi:hypothetical protein